MGNYQLTIAIPTYNRSALLKRCVEFLYLQKEYFDHRVELIISDNASTDDTGNIVDEFIKKGLPVRYIRNSENKGADFNIAQCYLEAKGAYVVALGDDDVLLNGSIRKILTLIDEGEYGIIFLNYFLFKNVLNTTILQNSNAGYDVYDNFKAFLSKVNYNITFISGNIINKKHFAPEQLKYADTSMVQVSVILNSILQHNQNVFVSEKLLAVQTENTGGYNLINVFGINLPQIIDDTQLNYPDKSFRKYIVSPLLLDFIPFLFIRLSKGNHKFEAEKTISIKNKLDIKFKGNFYYKLMLPLFYLPSGLLKIYFYIFVKPTSKAYKLISFLQHKNSKHTFKFK